MLLGFIVHFNPKPLISFDSTVQNVVRGSLPDAETHFFKMITVLGNTSVQIVIAAIAVVVIWLKKWHREAVYLLMNAVLAGICIVGIKNIVQRPRPSLVHLVNADGFSFPSGHSLGSFLIFGTIMLILIHHVQSPLLKWVVAIVIGLIILFVGLSRIYVGVHYPSDVLGGFLLAFGLHNMTYPYMKQRWTH